jgi:HlyD family secretion protein
MTRKLGRFINGTLLLGAIGAGVAYFALRKSASDQPITFRVAKVDKGSVVQSVTATGQLSAVVTVQVGSQVSGIILKLGADFNSIVKAGQIIAQIDPTRIKATLAQSRAQLKNAEASAARAKVNHEAAKRELDRAHALGEKRVIGTQEIDELRSRFDLAKVELLSSEAQVAQARASVGMATVDLERTIIKSPIDGVVLQRAVDVGQTVAASLQAPTLFTIAQDLSKMEVRAAIDEADVGKLKEGLEARFTVDAHPGREFVATIFQIRSNPNVQQNVVTYDAILRVDNPDGKLRPGMTANVRVVTEKRDDVLRVPNAALRFKPAPEILLAQTGAPGALGGPGGFARGDGGVPPEWQRRMAEGGRPPGGGGPGGGWRGGGGGGPEGRGFGGPGGGGRRGAGGEMARVQARVYKAQGEKVIALPFRPGIADEEYTEILRGPIKEGDEIVLEASGGILQQSAPRAQPMGGGMRPGGSSRGPRFF